MLDVKRFSTAVLGASGYVGAELMRLLDGHPQFSIDCVTAEVNAGEQIVKLFPSLVNFSGRCFSSLSQAARDLQGCDLVFSALPHGESAAILPELMPSLADRALLIDLSGDFRLHSASSYADWYGMRHPNPELLNDSFGISSSWRYGLPELFRDGIRKSRRISNPGCYATAVILACAPLVRFGLIQGSIVANGFSGVSGAGRTARPGLHFAQVFEDIRAYKVGQHQHTPEIEQALGELSGANSAGQEHKVSFTPHLMPIARGLQVTCSAEIAKGHSKDFLAAYREFYAGEPFLRISGELPWGTKDVRGTNMAAVSVHQDRRTDRVTAICVIDNLIKGAAGQAIQNANIALGLPEELGLPKQGMYP